MRRALLLVIVLSLSPACASTMPPNLSPQAVAAWRGTRVIHVLDVFRDTAIDANAQTPPLISTESTRKVVQFHKSAIEVIHAAPAGWVPMVRIGLKELLKNLTGAEKNLLDPYANLAIAILGG